MTDIQKLTLPTRQLTMVNSISAPVRKNTGKNLYMPNFRPGTAWSNLARNRL